MKLTWTRIILLLTLVVLFGPSETTFATPPLIPPSQSAPDEEVVRIFWHEATERPEFLENGEAHAVNLGFSRTDTPAPDELALAFVDTYSEDLQLDPDNIEWVVRRMEDDPLNESRTLVVFQQVYQGLPVFGSGLAVHIEEKAIIAVNGAYISNIDLSPEPMISREEAYEAALEQTELTDHTLVSNELVIYNVGFLASTNSNHLTYLLTIENDSLPSSYTVLIDAHTGQLLLHFSNLHEGREREIYDYNFYDFGEKCYTESGPIGSPHDDCKDAFIYTGDTYDYFYNTHNRDSFDNKGAKMMAYVRDGYTIMNAYWNGFFTVFGPQMATKDIVAHEWTHGVTQHTAGLIYSGESGALNESMSDIFAAMIDRDDWTLGEGSALGVIRSLIDPTIYGDPGKVTDSEAYCSYGDSGGVHYNSGIPNHAAYLMSEGGTYNGRTITAIGRSKTEKIFYRALTQYLTPSSNFHDAYNALNSGCVDLYGSTSLTCANVKLALQATEMNQPICATESPYYPNYVSATDGSYTDKVQVSWYPVTGATRYYVYRATSYYSEPSEIGNVAGVTFDDTTAVPGVLYYYYVRAYNSSGYSDYSYDDSGWRKLNIPTTVDATDGIYSDKVQVSWNSVEEANEYDIYRATSATGAKTYQDTTNKTSFDDTTAEPGVVYYYFIKAYRGSYYDSNFSDYDTGYRSDGTEEITLSIDPSSQTIGIGDTFSVTVEVQTEGEKIDGVSSHLSFDPTYLQVVDPTTGNETNQISPGMAFSTVSQNSVDNEAGEITFAASGNPTATSFTLATIHFKTMVLNPDGTNIRFLTETEASYQSESLPLIASKGTIKIKKISQFSGKVTLQGRGNPSSQWDKYPLFVEFYTPGTDNLVAFYQTETDSSGIFTITTDKGGVYDIKVKNAHSLSNKRTNIEITTNATPVDFGTLLEGDANDNDLISEEDYTILTTAYFKCQDQEGWDVRADFNGDTCIKSNDYSLLATNYGKEGPTIISALSTLALENTSAPTVILSMDPSTTNAIVGETFAMNIQIQNNTQGIDAVDAILNFDPAYLQIVDSNGNEIHQVEANSTLPVMLQNQVDQGKGQILFSVGKSLGTSAINGDFVLATVRFKLINALPSEGLSINFDPSSEVSRNGQSVLAETQNGSVVDPAADEADRIFLPFVTKSDGGAKVSTISK